MLPVETAAPAMSASARTWTYVPGRTRLSSANVSAIQSSLDRDQFQAVEEGLRVAVGHEPDAAGAGKRGIAARERRRIVEKPLEVGPRRDDFQPRGRADDEALRVVE